MADGMVCSKLRDLLTGLVTPFDHALKIDHDALTRLCPVLNSSCRST